MWERREIREHGGVTASLLAEMHNRAYDDRRKLANDTYSYLRRGTLYGIPSPCPDCGGFAGRDGPRRKYTKPCLTCSMFDIKLHKSVIASVTLKTIRLPTYTLLMWPTMITADRVNTVLTNTPWWLYRSGRKPYLNNRERKETWRIDYIEDRPEIIIDRSTMWAPNIYSYATLVDTPITHPNIENAEAVYPPSQYTMKQSFFFSIPTLNSYDRLNARRTP